MHRPYIGLDVKLYLDVVVQASQSIGLSGSQKWMYRLCQTGILLAILFSDKPEMDVSFVPDQQIPHHPIYLIPKMDGKFVPEKSLLDEGNPPPLSKL